jgi:hypothetical protein
MQPGASIAIVVIAQLPAFKRAPAASLGCQPSMQTIGGQLHVAARLMRAVSEGCSVPGRQFA